MATVDAGTTADSLLCSTTAMQKDREVQSDIQGSKMVAAGRGRIVATAGQQLSLGEEEEEEEKDQINGSSSRGRRSHSLQLQESGRLTNKPTRSYRKQELPLTVIGQERKLSTHQLHRKGLPLLLLLLLLTVMAT